MLLLSIFRPAARLQVSGSSGIEGLNLVAECAHFTLFGILQSPIELKVYTLNSATM